MAHRSCVYGDITRELHELWCRWMTTNGEGVATPATPTSAADRLAGPRLQGLFHLAGIYPSQSQILEMVHCARQHRTRSSSTSTTPPATPTGPPPPATPTDADNYLTFGEFCLFVTELKKCYEREIPRPTQLSKLPDKLSASERMKMRDRKISKSASKYEVFLGGSCNPTTWRQEVAIPTLKSLGITYFNPQVPHWGPELIEKEHHAKQTAEKKFVLVIDRYEGPGQVIQGEPISEQEFDDLETGQLVLQDLLERLGIPVFTTIRPALECTAKILREKISLQDLGLSDGVSPVRNSHYPIGDKLIKLRDAFDALDTSDSGQLSLADVCMAFRILTNRDLSVDDLRNIVASSRAADEVEAPPTSVTFDQFCCIFTEFRNQPTDGKRLWDVLVSKAAALFQTVVSPVSRVLCRPKGVTRCDSCSPEVTVGGARDVYLGGSCGSTTWRQQVAIPMLKKSGLTFFNPRTCGWSRRFIPIEAAAIDASRVLLFAITRQTRSLSAMALAAHYIGLGCNVVLVVQHLRDHCEIKGEKLSAPAIKDYNRGRNYLSDLANREGVPVFEDISEAMECVIQRCLHPHQQQQQQQQQPPPPPPPQEPQQQQQQQQQLQQQQQQKQPNRQPRS